MALSDMSDPNKLAEAIVSRLSQNLADNQAFSSIKRAASASEELAKGISRLTDELKQSGKSSEKLSRSLNNLTLALVVIGAASAIIALAGLFVA